ncbi:MAG TPA: hypothetical protein PK230_05465, partial [Chitinophagales bacterium]|nr:hypothetical protein [Chitinophagales bacterium]
LPAGNYTVTVTDSGNSNCSQTATFTIDNAPALFVTVGNIANQTACNVDNGSISITVSGGTPPTDPALPPYQYVWSHDATLNAATATNLAPNTYTVTVSDATGCQVTATANIAPATISFSVTTPSPICAGQNLVLSSLNGNGAGSFVWYDGIPSQGNIVTTVSPTISTTYWVLYTQNGCTDSTSVNVVVNPFQVPFFAPPAPICVGESVNLTALIPGNATWYDAQPPAGNVVTNVSPTQNATYWVIYQENACADTAFVDVVVNPLPTIALNAPPTICNGASIDLSGLSNPPAIWYDAAPPSGNVVTNVSPTQTTTYYAVVTQNNCTSSATLVVTVAPNPDLANIPPPAPICSDGTASIDLNTLLPADANNTNAIFTWYSDSNFSTAIGSNVTSSGTYYLQATTNNDCTDTSSVTIVFNSIPPAPLSLGDVSVCFGESSADVAVEDAGNNFIVNWYDAAVDGNLIGTGNPITLPVGATYYAALEDNTSLCEGERTAVSIVENPELVYTDLGSICSNDLLTYSTTLSVSSNVTDLSAPPYTVVNNGDNTFTISGIPSGEGHTFVLLDANACTVAGDILPFNCDCPTIDAPTNPIPNSMCNGGTPTALSVATPSAGLVVQWYDAANGGTLLFTGNPFTPNAAGTYYAQYYDATNACSSGSISVTLTETSAINITPEAGVCANDLLSYSVDITISGGTAPYNVNAGAVSVSNNGNNSYSLLSVVVGTDVTVTVVDADGCQQNSNITSPTCDCPTVPSPSNPQNSNVCANENPTALSVDAPPAGYSVVWYDSLIGNTVVGNGVSFVPPDFGTYYAALINTANACEGVRIELNATQSTALQINPNAGECSADLTNYSVDIAVTGGSLPYVLNSNVGNVTDNGNGNFVLQNIPDNT